ncbi:MAG: hydrogenase maturation protein [Gammaproteobacteria bacterium]|nr:MAG: hydrogenase maturation protein [Gammaproteobacteria bacterium]
MRILLLCHSFNSLTQAVHARLRELGHTVSVEYDIHDAVTEEAVSLFAPDVIVAPFLKRAIPASVWQHVPCLIIHPGPPGDRGPSALDWAILKGHEHWGVTVLQAVEEMDAGPVWAWRPVALYSERKGALYRNRIVPAALSALEEALERLQAGASPVPADAFMSDLPQVTGWQPPMKQADRAIDWSRDDTATVLRKIHSADGWPGLLDDSEAEPVYLFNACAVADLHGAPGTWIGQQDGGFFRATRDGAVWIGHMRARPNSTDVPTLKLPATQVRPDLAASLPELTHLPSLVRYEEKENVGILHFPFYNGAMRETDCRALEEAVTRALTRPIKVLALAGGPEFFSNGIHLYDIETAESPAEASWQTIQAMDDLCERLLKADSVLTASLLQGNAGAGGFFMALTADALWARDGVILNPHYRNMGNLYGSEYWTYTLPRRLDEEAALKLADARLPLNAQQALNTGLLDAIGPATHSVFMDWAWTNLLRLSEDPSLPVQLEAKRNRLKDDAERIARCRAQELAHMHQNFFGFDPSYHFARYHFVHKIPKSRTPRYLAIHR